MKGIFYVWDTFQVQEISLVTTLSARNSPLSRIFVQVFCTVFKFHFINYFLPLRLHFAGELMTLSKGYRYQSKIPLDFPIEFQNLEGLHSDCFLSEITEK